MDHYPLLSALGGAWLHEHGAWIAAGACWLAALCALLDLALPAWGGRRRGRLFWLCLAVIALTAAHVRFQFDQPATAVLQLAGYAIVLGYLCRYGWNRCGTASRGRAVWIVGAGVLLLSVLIKTAWLSDWPPILTDYAAMNGVDALKAYEQGWPDNLFAGAANDLQSGGQSPLHLPVLLALYNTIGPTPFSVRFAEVLGSTLALGFLLLWLLRAMPGWWGVGAFTLVALSPWHLAQSRMGTYQSISLAVALAVLYFAHRIDARYRPHWLTWLGFGIAAGLIGYGYAPMRSLYLLVGAVFGVYFVTRRRALASWRAWVGPVLGLAIFASALTVQTWGAGGFERMFQTRMGVLATDTAIWNKTLDDRITQERQPWPVVANNFGRNAGLLYEWVYNEHRVHALFVPGAVFGLLFSIVAIARGWGWVAPLYYLLGVLPTLIVFPELRRSFVMQPLVLVAAVLFAQGICHDAERLIPHVAWRVACRVLIGFLLACSVLHGLHLFAKTNARVGISPSFGTIYRQDFIEEVQSILPAHYVYVLNPSFLQAGIEMGLYHASAKLDRDVRYAFLNVNPQTDIVPYAQRGEPVCFAYLQEANRDWIAGWLSERLPEGRLVKRLAPDNGQLMYVLYYYEPEATPAPTTDNAD